MSRTRSLVTLALYGIAAIALAAVLWTVAHRLFVLPRQAAEARGEAIVQEETARASGEAVEDALTTTNEVHREYVRIEEVTRSNDHAIKQATGADTRIPAVTSALRRSLCNRAVYRSEPDCIALLGNDSSVGAAGGDDGSASAP